MIYLNIGSGQRPFKQPWFNSDIQEKWKTPTEAAGCQWVYDKVIQTGHEEQADVICLHHVIEHFGCGEADALIDNCRRLLKPAGSLLIFVPNVYALAQRWLTHQLDTQLYMTNIYGAYMGDEADRHHWGYTYSTLQQYLNKWPWQTVRPFDWRAIEGADIARDWWIIGVEAIK